MTPTQTEKTYATKLLALLASQLAANPHSVFAMAANNHITIATTEPRDQPRIVGRSGKNITCLSTVASAMGYHLTLAEPAGYVPEGAYTGESFATDKDMVEELLDCLDNALEMSIADFDLAEEPSSCMVGIVAAHPPDFTVATSLQALFRAALRRRHNNNPDFQSDITWAN